MSAAIAVAPTVAVIASITTYLLNLFTLIPLEVETERSVRSSKDRCRLCLIRVCEKQVVSSCDAMTTQSKSAGSAGAFFR
jgi:hypothetical protein